MRDPNTSAYAFNWWQKPKDFAYKLDSSGDPLHGFVQGDVQPSGDAFVEPGVAVPELTLVGVWLENFVPVSAIFHDRSIGSLLKDQREQKMLSSERNTNEKMTIYINVTWRNFVERGRARRALFRWPACRWRSRWLSSPWRWPASTSHKSSRWSRGRRRSAADKKMLRQIKI